MKIAIITGASSGMGRDFARQLDQTGNYEQLWVIARREERLLTLKEELKTPVKVFPMDLTKQEDLECYAAELEKEKPQVLTLVNAGGFGKFGRVEQIPLSDCMGMIDVNCKALVSMTQLTLPYMERGSAVIELGSLSSFQPVPYLNVYAASKAFVLSYSRALNVELKPRGIRVMAVCPGWVKTEFFDRATKTSNDAVTYYNVFSESADVVRTALRDLKRGKDVSVHNFRVRAQVRLVKLLPHKWVMNIWMKQQKHS